MAEPTPESVAANLDAEFKARVAACYQAPSRTIARELASGIRADYAATLPSAVSCFEDDLEAWIAHLRLPVTHRRSTRRIGAIFERARRSGGAQHSTERSRLRPDQRAHNRDHSGRDACFLMGAVRLMMNLPSPRQLPAQAQCNATDQFEGANSTACDCVRSGTPPVLLKPLWAGSAHVVQFRPVVIE